MSRKYLYNVLVSIFVLYAIPAEASSESGSFAGIGYVALVAGVVVLTLVMKRFMG